MKKFRLLALCLMLLFGTSVLFASEGKGKETKEDKMSTEIATLLTSSKNYLENDAKALVTFVVNKNNEVVILTIDNENNAVRNFIKSRLNYKKLKTKATVGEEYRLPVTIKS